MAKKGTPPFTFQHVYPRVRYMMGLGRNIYKLGANLRTSF